VNVSVLIVGFHTYDEIDRCLSSIETHEPDVDVIVVDHDADPVRGRELSLAHPRVTYEPRSENLGFAAGINRAARRAATPLLVILNPDVELRAPIVQTLAACLASHPNAAIVGGLVREADGRVQASARRFPNLSTAFGGRTSWLTRVAPGNPLTRRNLAPTNLEAGCTEVDWVTGAFMMVRHDVFESLDGFDERFFMYWEDSDLCLRALKAGWKTMYEPRAEVIHLTGRASRHAPLRSQLAFHRSVFHYYWKHAGIIGRLISPLVAAGLVIRICVRLFGRLFTSSSVGSP
jgi:N-acetylglucosaminyl-diphospho-decaprenol L-rhamnosyltransferase